MPGILDWFGKGMGFNQFETDPGKFQLPGYDQTQQQAQAGYNAMGGANAGQADTGFRNQQGQLSQTLFDQMNGGGPNLAQQQLKQATDRNIAQSYAMGQGGQGSENSRLAMMQNAGAANRQAAGDSASLRMQQQLAAQGQLGGLLSGARGQDLSQAGLNAQMAQGYMQQQQAANQAQMQGGIAQQQIQAGGYENSANRGAGVQGGLLSGLGTSAINPISNFARGGAVAGYADGGPVGLGYFGMGLPTIYPAAPVDMSGGKKEKAPDTGAPAGTLTDADAMGNTSALGGTAGMGDLAAPAGMAGAEGGGMMAMGGGLGLSGAAGGGAVAAGGAEGLAELAPLLLLAYSGGGVPGRAQVSGDSARNDTVPARLSPGEVVLPRSVVDDPDAEEKAAAFVKAIKAKKASR